jgi:2-amino-4-hydroxy-6-hydroxymethyldihydropteridine diphosphokinase
MNPVECGIALGSNTGDRLAHLRAALEELRAADPHLEVSPVYETAPVDCPAGSGAFLNAVAIVRWSGTPEALLEWLRGIESRLGRPRERAKNSPRSIDLDILYAGDAMLRTPELILPHPRLHERRFVLQPLCDLRPALLLPGMSGTVAELLAALPPGAVTRL